MGCRRDHDITADRKRPAVAIMDPGQSEFLAACASHSRVQVGGQITASTAYESPAHQNEVEFVREPIAELAHIFGSVGHSPDREALIFWHAQLYLVPMADIVGFPVDRVQPARGAGGSKLYVECGTNYQDVAAQRLMIGAAQG